MKYGYARVSTTEQHLDRQMTLLITQGIEEPNIYTDKMSGKEKNRPAFNELKSILKPGDQVYTESLSRLSRNTRDLLSIIEEWTEQGITYISIKEQFDFLSPTGKLILNVLSAVSQLERDMIVERVKEGLEAARARGRTGGRPKTKKEKLSKALSLYDTRLYSLKEIREMTGVSTSVLYREKAAQRTSDLDKSASEKR